MIPFLTFEHPHNGPLLAKATYSDEGQPLIEYSLWIDNVELLAIAEFDNSLEGQRQRNQQMQTLTLDNFMTHLVQLAGGQTTLQHLTDNDDPLDYHACP